MSDKCNWKDGKLTFCNNLRDAIGEYYTRKNVYLFGKEAISCPFCGADIRKYELKYCNSECGMRMSIQAGSCQNYTCISAKPEPAEPLIVKSGETLVAKDVDGINYICTIKNLHKDNLNSIHWIRYSPVYFKNSISWKSFTGPNPDITELTDEIAKLRPMVVIKETNIENIKILTYIDDTLIQCRGVTYFKEIIDCRLATAHELQESQ